MRPDLRELETSGVSGLCHVHSCVTCDNAPFVGGEHEPG
jgi:hypothetical protein